MKKAIILILFVALVLRLIGTFTEPLYVDETASLAIAQDPISAIHGTFAVEEHPPLFNVILSLWKPIAGTNTGILRLLPVLLGVASVFVAYLIVRMLLSENVALLTAGFIALAPEHVKMSEQLRPYILVVFLVFLSLYFFLRALRDGRTGSWIGYIVSTVLSGYASHFTALMMVTVFLLGIYWKKRLKAFLVAEAIIFVLLIPNMIYVSYQLDYLRYMAQFGPAVSALWKYFILPYNLFSFIFGTNTPMLQNFHPVLMFIPVLLVGVVVLGYLIYRGVSMRREPLVFLLATLAIPLLLVWGMSFFSYIQIEPKRFLFATIGIYALVAYGLSTLKNAWRIVAGVVVVGVLAIGLIGFYQYHEIDWPGAAKYVTDREQAGDAITVATNIMELPFKYYYSGNAPVVGVPGEYLPKEFLERFSRRNDASIIVTSENVASLFAGPLNDKQRIWYVSIKDETSDPHHLFYSYLASHFSLASNETVARGRVTIYLFSK